MPLPTNTRLLTVVVPGVGIPIDSSQAAILESVSDALTAHSGGTQAAALALTSKFNVVATVAAVADSVKLPPALVGLAITVVNNGANPMQVFGAGTDTINSVATATGIAQAAGTVVAYRCNVAGNWLTGRVAGSVVAPTLITADGAVNPHISANYVVTKAGVAALTIAAPTAGVDDGVNIEITSSTNNQHVLTFTGNTLNSGAAGHATATWPAQLGGAIKLMAYNGKWNLMANQLAVIA